MHAATSILSSCDKTVRIHYINSIGAVIDNSLMLHIHDKSLIEIEDIRKVEIYKTRSFFYNAFFVFCSLPLFYSLLIHEFTSMEKALIYALIGILLGFAFFIENCNYVMFIRKFDLNFIEIKVDKNYKDDAKKITQIVNTRIKQLK